MRSLAALVVFLTALPAAAQTRPSTEAMEVEMTLASATQTGRFSTLQHFAPTMQVQYRVSVDGLPEAPGVAAFADLAADPAFVSLSVTSDPAQTRLEMAFDFETLDALAAWVRRVDLNDRFGEETHIQTRLDVRRDEPRHGGWDDTVTGEIIDESIIEQID